MKTLSLTILALAVAAPALAQTASVAPAKPPAHAPLRNAVQTRAEVGAHVQAMFAKLDANRDGFIAKDEAQSAGKALREGRGKRADGFDPAQRQQRRAPAFDRLDTDRNGVISREEFARIGADRDQRGEASADRRGREGFRGRGMGAFGARMFETADANRDGKVSLQEATAAAYQHFDSADLNRDGKLTGEERMQAHQKMRAQRPRG